MQCPSCQFENMPGSSLCARCAATLTFQTDEIDVNPPRASSFERRLPSRLIASVRLSMASIRTVLGKIVGLYRPSAHFEGQLTEYLSLAIPGLHQIQRGEPQRGKIMLAVYLTLLLLTLVLAGTRVGSLFLGILFAWHVVSAVDALVRDFDQPIDRLRFTATIGILVLALVYLPSLWLIQRFAVPLNIGISTRYFNAGDVVWYSQFANPDVGDLVLYDVPTTGLAGRRNQYNVQYRVAGLRINRLVATAGQTLRIEDGKLLVDGDISPWQPAVNLHLAAGQEVIVRPNHVFILPEDMVPGQTINAQFSQRLGMIPANNVRGALFARTFPPTRVRFY